MKLLATAKEVRDGIRFVLEDPRDQRVVLVAFVGADASAYLPHPKGIKLYCWPRAGGTNPDAIQDLKKQGVDIRFVHGLHAKLYWSSKRGAVIGSANLTNNALGEGGLYEIAVRVPAGQISLRPILRGLKVEPDFDAVLKKLHTEHINFYNKNSKWKIVSGGKRTRPKSFLGWMSQGPSRQEWRLGWYPEEAKPPADASKAYKKLTGSVEDDYYLGVKRKGDFKPGVFVLGCLVRGNPKLDVTTASDLHWWNPAIYTKTKEPSWHKDPHIWFARDPVQAAVQRPFDCEDKLFVKAFAEVISDQGGIEFLESLPSLTPTEVFLKEIARRYRQLQKRTKK